MGKLKQAAPTLVAHRGYSGKYPENTLLAYQAAYDVGAVYMELDLQLTKDMVPVLHHDTSLNRMTGVDLDVREVSVQKFLALKPSHPERFGKKFTDNNFTTFRDFCEWLALHPDVTTFVEIKQESIDIAGVAQFINLVCNEINRAGVEDQCVIISFNYECLEYTRSVSNLRVGWVLPEWSANNHLLAQRLNSEFLFCDKEYLPNNSDLIWPGDWEWAIYNLDDVGAAIAMANRGFKFLESNQIGTLLEDKELGHAT